MKLPQRQDSFKNKPSVIPEKTPSPVSAPSSSKAPEWIKSHGSSVKYDQNNRPYIEQRIVYTHKVYLDNGQTVQMYGQGMSYVKTLGSVSQTAAKQKQFKKQKEAMKQVKIEEESF